MNRLVFCFTLAAFLLAADKLPRVDLHAHLDAESPKGRGLTPSEATAVSKKLRVRLGVLAEGGCRGEIRDDRTLVAFITSLEGQPLWRGLQVYGFDWPTCLSKANLARLDKVQGYRAVKAPFVVKDVIPAQVRR